MTTQTPTLAPLAGLRIELRKLFDTPAQKILIGVIAGACVVMASIIGFSVGAADRTVGSFFEGAMIPLLLVWPVVGVLALASEWQNGTAMITYTLNPRRTQVLVWKLVALMVVTVIAVAGVVALTMVLGLTGESPAYADALDTTWRVMLAIGLMTLAGAALGAALLNSVGGIVMLVVVMPLTANLLGSFRVTEAIAPYVDMQSLAMRIASGQWPDAGVAVSVLSIWIVLPLAVGIWRNARREA